MIILFLILLYLLITYIMVLVNFILNSKINLDELIEKQSCGIASQFRFGLKKAKCNGCGWISSYNVLRMLDDKKAPQYIISLLEILLAPIALGFFGTNPLSIALMFRIFGYRVSIKRRAPQVENFAADAGIALYFTKNLHAHYVAFSKKDDSFVIHNPNVTVGDFSEYIDGKNRIFTLCINISKRV